MNYETSAALLHLAGMPIYHFHIPGIENGDGYELVDDVRAKREAAAAFGEMISHDNGATELQMEVTDSTGRRVATLTYSLS